MRKKRGLASLKNLLKSYNNVLHSYEGYVAPCKPTGSLVRQILPSGLLTLSIFKWISLTLPDGIYPNKFQFSSYDVGSRASTDSFLRCKALIPDKIFHKIKIKKSTGYTQLLHSKALLDAYNSKKIFKGFKEYVRKMKRVERWERRKRGERFFGRWRVYVLLNVRSLVSYIFIIFLFVDR